MVPPGHRLAVIVNVANPQSVLELSQVQATARALGLDIAVFEIRRSEEITAAFDALNGRADAIYVCSDALTYMERTRINSLAIGLRLPTVYNFSGMVEAGGLMSYGPNFLALFRRAADLVDKILRGAKPSEIPVEQPTKFDLAINLTTAKALGLIVPDKLLALADEVIE
jgi:putative ABC transport system substrate-binding protein